MADPAPLDELGSLEVAIKGNIQPLLDSFDQAKQEGDKFAQLWASNFDTTAGGFNKMTEAAANSNNVFKVLAEGAAPAVIEALGDADKVISGISSTMGTTIAAGTSLIGVLAGGVGVVAAFEAVKEVIELTKGAMESFNQTLVQAHNVGVSTDFFQGFRLAVTEAGGSAEQAGTALQRFSYISDIASQGQGTLAKALRTVGDEYLQNFREADTAEAKIRVLADAEKAASTQAEANAITHAAFGRGMSLLTQALQGGAEALDKITEQGKELGIVIDQDVLEQAHELNDQFEIASLVIDSKLKQAFLNLAPLLVRAAQALATLAGAVASAAKETKQGGEAIATELENIYDVVKKLIETGNLDWDKLLNTTVIPEAARLLGDLLNPLAAIERHFTSIAAHKAGLAAGGALPDLKFGDYSSPGYKAGPQDLPQLNFGQYTAGTQAVAGLNAQLKDMAYYLKLDKQTIDELGDGLDKEVVATHAEAAAVGLGVGAKAAYVKQAQIEEILDQRAYKNKTELAAIMSVLGPKIQQIGANMQAAAVAQAMWNAQFEASQRFLPRFQQQADSALEAIFGAKWQAEVDSDLGKILRLNAAYSQLGINIGDNLTSKFEAFKLVLADLNKQFAQNQISLYQYIATLGQAAANLTQPFSNALSTMQGFTSQLEGENKKWFEINKAISIAQALINTFVGATKAFSELGPIFGPPAAAAIVAAGLAYVAKIAATQPGSGTGGAAGGSIGHTSVGKAAAPAARTVTQTGPQRVAFIQIQGQQFSRAAVEDLVTQLIQFQREGGQILLAKK